MVVDSFSASNRLRSELRYFVYFVGASPLFLVGLAIVSAAVLLFLIGPAIAPYPTESSGTALPLTAPSLSHLMGTDSNGFDIFSRTIAAPRVDVLIGVVSTALSLVAGVLSGVWAGYYSGTKGIAGRGSEVTMRLMDILQAFPVFILALALAAAAGPSVPNVIFVISFLNFPVFLRLTRSAVLSTRERSYMEAAQCAGNSELRLLLRHILPNSLGPALIAASVAVGQAILITAGLSFVGAGVRVPTPEWGSMIAIGAPNMITGQWWPALFPGIALGLTVLGFALVGDGLRHFLDPTRRR